VLFGVLGAVLMLAGGSWYQATVTPPYRFIDEQAHAGYVLAVQDGQIPSIDTPIDQASGGSALRERLATEPARRQDVWVANNPPLTYLIATGPAALTRALGVPGGPLLGLRLVNVAAASAAVALTYLLARDLAGGDRIVGLVAAGLVAAMPHLGFVASLGFNDGVSLLATTSVLLALARVCGAGVTSPGGRQVQFLGICCALAAASRPMALVVAAVAGALGLAVTWWRHQAPALWSFGWLAAPTVVTSGWFYLLNLRRYGDPTGSAALFEKFGREPEQSLRFFLTSKGVWESALRTITTRRLGVPLPGDSRGWYQVAVVVVVVGVVGATALVVRSAVIHRRHAKGGSVVAGALPGMAWLALAMVSLVPVLLTAQHRAGGGAPHPRYLFPMLPVVAAAVALVAVRLATRWSGIALVVAVSAVAWQQTRASARWLADNPAGPPGSELVAAYGTEVLRGAGLAAAALGLVLLIATIAGNPNTTVDRS